MTREQSKLSSVPEGWLWVSTGEVSFLVTKGSTPTSYGFTYKSKGINFVRVENLENHRIQLNTIKKFIDKDTYLFLKRSQLKQNDILFSIAGTIGRVAVVAQNDLPANTNQALAIIRFPWKLINPHYLAAYFDSSMSLSLIRKKHRGVGIKNIGLQDIKEIIFPLAPFSEQERIVRKLEELFIKLDAGVKSLQNVRTQIELYRQAVLKYAFTGKLTEEWRKTHKDTIEPAQKLLERLKQEKKLALGKKFKESSPPDATELPDPPENWLWVKLNDVTCKIVDGSHNPPPKQVSGIPMLSARNIIDNRIVFSDYRFISLEDFEREKIRVNIHTNDVLLTIVGTIGRSAVVTENTPIFAIQRSVAVIRTNIRPRYLSWILQSPFYSLYFLEKARGTAQKGIYLNQLKEMPILVPPLLEQDKIVEGIEQDFSVVDTIIEGVERICAQANKLRQSVLKSAFEGKLVRRDSADEPAEKLLERIRKEKRYNYTEIDLKKIKRKQRRINAYVK